LLNLPQPSTIGIQSYTYHVFSQVDDDNSGAVELDEFSYYIKHSDVV